MLDKFIDLHVHSNYSDGTKTLNYIYDSCIENNVNVLALAEHYNLSSYRKFRKLSKNTIEVVPATELSASLLNYGLSKRHVCHIIAYYPTSKIYSLLDSYELSRDKCVKKTLEMLQKEGVNITYTKVCKVARDKKSIGRFDIAISLAHLGYSKTPVEAYEKFFDEKSPVYVDREKMCVKDLIQNILLIGGVPVLAHPKTLRLNNSDFEGFISELKAFGLKGMEVYNPHNNDEQREFFNNICNSYELIATVGSDYHGRSGDNIEIGLGIDNNLKISDYSIIEKLKKEKHKIYE